MQVTVVSKIQGTSVFSSEGISVTLSSEDIGISLLSGEKQVKEVFDRLCAFGNHLIATELYRRGYIEKDEAERRRKSYLILLGKGNVEQSGSLSGS